MYFSQEYSKRRNSLYGINESDPIPGRRGVRNNEQMNTFEIQLREKIEKLEKRLDSVENDSGLKNIAKFNIDLIQEMNEKLNKRSKQIEEKIEKAEDKLKQLKSQLQDKIQFENTKLNSAVQDKIIELNKQNKLSVLKKVQESIQFTSNKFMNHLNCQLKEMANKISLEIQSLRTKVQQIQQSQKRYKTITDPNFQKNMIDNSTPFIKEFEIEKRTVSLLSTTEYRLAQILFTENINKNKEYSLKFNIKKKNSQWLGLGVVDRLAQRKAQWSSISPNAVCYRSSGWITYPINGRPVGEKLNGGFNQSDTIEIRVALSTGQVDWYVNDCLSATMMVDMLESDDREFVVYAELAPKDAIQWSLSDNL